MSDVILQIIATVVIGLTTGGVTYQSGTNKSQSERIERLERDFPKLQQDVVNFNDVIIAQFGSLNDQMVLLREQRKESQTMLDIRLNHLDNLLGGLYQAYVEDRNERDDSHL